MNSPKTFVTFIQIKCLQVFLVVYQFLIEQEDIEIDCENSPWNNISRWWADHSDELK